MEAGLFMFNKRGSTLIESLFAFEIFITVLVLFVSLMTSVFSQEKRILENYQYILQKEGELTYEHDFTEIINQVLH